MHLHLHPQLAPEATSLVTANLPLVGHLVREVLARVPAQVRREDLFSAGSLALVTAARTFDPSRGTPFTAFAAMRIRGALLDDLRGQDWASRSVRGKARRVDAVRAEFIAAHGRVPSTAELAQAMDVDPRELAAIAQDVHRSAVLSLQGFTDSVLDDLAPERQPGPEQLLLDRERIGYLRDAVAALPSRLRTVVVGYFFEERPMAELAAEFRVTESRISQLRAEALVLLRDGLNAHLAPERVRAPRRPDGCAARRRASYYAQIGAGGTVQSRLAHTSQDGLPLLRTA